MKLGHYLTLSLLALVFSLSLHKVYDPDFWMHVAAGEYLWKTHTVLHANMFSFTYPQREWIDVYWLYELVLSWFWQWGQAAAVTAFRIVLVFALVTLVFLGFRNRRPLLSASDAGVLLLAWLLLAPRLTDRPELVSFVLFAATLTLVRRKRWWWCLPLQLIWANVHGFFCLGPITLALATASEWISGRRRPAVEAFLASLASAAVCVVSPFGWRNWLVLIRGSVTMQTLAGEVEELASPFHPVVRATNGSGWLLIVFVVLAAIILMANYKSVSAFDWLVMAASLPLAFSVQRSIPVFVLASLPALLAVTPRMEKPLAGAAVGCLCLALAAGLRIHGREFGVGIASDQFPKQAVDFLQSHTHGPLRLFNAEFGSGGYLIARGLPVFIDGRLEAYPTEFVREYLHALDDDTAFRTMARDHAVTHALVVTTRADMRLFAQRLNSSPEWKMLYADGVAMVFERRP